MSPQRHPETGDTSPVVRIARGSMYFDRALCDRYFAGIQTVATIRRDGTVFVLPLVGSAAGGSLLKVRNARGDRVIHALEFLRTLGIDADTPERCVAVRWDSNLAGLRLEGLETNGVFAQVLPSL